MDMINKERQLIEITDSIYLRPLMFTERKDGSEQFNVCIKTETGELAAMELITRNSNGVFSFNEAAIGTIGSPEFDRYIRKFQASPDLSAFDGRLIPQNEEALYQRVSEAYAQTKSLKQTAKLLSLSEERTRRILFTTGDYTCKIHENLMKALREGKTLDEAAESAGVSRSRVHAYLPYGVN